MLDELAPSGIESLTWMSLLIQHMLYSTGPDSLVDKASASEVGGRRLDSQCRRQWGSF